MRKLSKVEMDTFMNLMEIKGVIKNTIQFDKEYKIYVLNLDLPADCGHSYVAPKYKRPFETPGTKLPDLLR